MAISANQEIPAKKDGETTRQDLNSKDRGIGMSEGSAQDEMKAPRRT